MKREPKKSSPAKRSPAKRRTKLDHYSDAPYNPRDITPAALKHLGESERVFGDLSGFVVNKATGNVVCGHQRRAAFGSTTDIKWLSRVTCEVGPSDARFKSAERMGVVEAADGALFSVREVDWPEPFERAANIAANNPAIQGDFTEALPSLVESLHIDFSDSFLESVGLDGLPFLSPEKSVEEPSEFPSVGEDIAVEHKCPKCGYEWSGLSS